MVKYLVPFTFFLFLNVTLSGQCLDKVALWNRIYYLKDSTKVADQAQLNELDGYLRKLKVCNGLRDSTAALLLMRIGILHFYQKDFLAAVDFIKESIHVIQSNAGRPGINEAHLARCYNYLQQFYDSLGNDVLKKKAIDSCIDYSIRYKSEYKSSAYHISNKVEYLFAIGDYYHCLELAKIGEEISAKSMYRPEDVFYYRIWQVNAFIFLNRLNDASNTLEKTFQEYKRSKNKSGFGSLLGLKATIAEKKGLAAESKQYALQSFHYEKNEQNYSNCASALNNLAEELYMKKLQRPDEALYYFREALKYAQTNDSIYILNNIANVYIQTRKFDTGFNFFQKAFDCISPGSDENYFLFRTHSELLANWNAEYLLGLVLDKAEGYIKRYDQYKVISNLQAAIRVYKSADRLMDKIKISQIELSSQLFWRSDTRRLYEKAIEACYLSGNMEDAFYFFEKSRAVLLNDQIQKQATGDPNMVETVVINKKISRLINRSAGLIPDSKEYNDCQRDIFANREKLKSLDDQIKNRNPWYYQSLFDTSFVRLQSVQKKLMTTNGLHSIIEFFDGDSAVYMLTITADHTYVLKIIKKDFEEGVNQYAGYLSNDRLANSDFAGFIQSGKKLYDLIFKTNPIPAGRVVISPDGKYFPFESLIADNTKTHPVYFLNDHIVSYTYSVRFLLNNFSLPGISDHRTFLGIAPVDYPATFHLNALTQSDVSLNNIALNFNSVLSFTGPQATRNHFMQNFQDYKIIQLYTHASDSSDRAEPVIYFSDSALYLSELIPENKTATQLIVLSACETGNGKLYRGEGVFSFNRSFAALGIPSSVINLWNVDDASTYKLTELFYKYVGQGLPLDEALQKAKLDFISSSSKQKKLPYYWAAAILAGKTDAIEISKNDGWLWTAIAGLVILIFISWIIIQRKSDSV